MFSVSTVKFDLQEDLEELQAKIYLDTKKKLSKKDILELAIVCRWPLSSNLLLHRDSALKFCQGPNLKDIQDCCGYE